MGQKPYKELYESVSDLLVKELYFIFLRSLNTGGRVKLRLCVFTLLLNLLFLVMYFN